MENQVINLFTGSYRSHRCICPSMDWSLSISHILFWKTMCLVATSIFLMNCTLDDMRQSREDSLVRIIERISSVSSSRLSEDHLEEHAKYNARSMLDVIVRRTTRSPTCEVLFQHHRLPRLSHENQGVFRCESTEQDGYYFLFEN